jgi:hypothetical protein
MHKQVMLPGLLLERPMYGQQIREVIEAHHDLYADFVKKPIIYYHLKELVFACSRLYGDGRQPHPQNNFLYVCAFIRSTLT